MTGGPLARRLPIAPSDRLARTVWTAACGLVAIGWVLALLGLLGLLHPNLVGSLTLLAAVWGLVELAQIALRQRLSRLQQAGKPPARTAMDCGPQWLRLRGRPALRVRIGCWRRSRW